MFEKEKEAFEELNRRLLKADTELTVICAGGYVLSHYGMRTTQDIDGFFQSDPAINQMIREVGDMFGINTPKELWLNNSIQNLNDKPAEEICDTVYDFSNLHVLIVPLDYVAGMKLTSAREQDIQDVAAIVRKMDIQDPDELLNKIHRYGFFHIDESVLLESFGIAYGMEWLEKYYLEHEEDINKRFREAEWDKET